MPFSHAVIFFDATVVAVLGVDFVAFRRRDDTVVARMPALLMIAVLIALSVEVTTDRGEFVVLGAIVLGAAMFGYANFLAFVKRGVTFSILSNHERTVADRLPDDQFIAIDDRLEEMRGHGWVRLVESRWMLTAAGHRVASVRRVLMRLLRIEAIG